MSVPWRDEPGTNLMKSLDTGSSMFTRYMQPIIQREQLAQQKALEEQMMQFRQKQLAQQWQQHVQSHALQQQQQDRLMEQFQHDKTLWPLYQQELQAKVKKAKYDAMPIGEKLKFLEDQMSNMNFGGASEPQTEEINLPEINLGQVASPIAGQTMQMPVEQPAQQTNPAMMDQQQLANAMLRAHLKELGLDPDYQTQAQKDANEMRKFEEKERIKAQNKKKENTEITQATRNEAQRIISATNSILPILNDLINMDIPNQNFSFLKPSDQEKYKRKSFLAADKLMTISKLPRIQESLHGALQLLRAGNFEDIGQYKEGLKELRSLVIQEATEQAEMLHTGRVPEVKLNFSEVTTGDNQGGEKPKLVIIRNKQTGEEKHVTEEQARKMGAIK